MPNFNLLDPKLWAKSALEYMDWLETRDKVIQERLKQMSNKIMIELSRTYKNATKKVQLRGIYEHRSSKHLYLVESVSLNASDGVTVTVNYSSQSSPILWSRPLDEFLECFNLVPSYDEA